MPSFSTRVKSELCRVLPEGDCCRAAELAGLIFTLDRSKKTGCRPAELLVRTENPAIARQFYRLASSFRFDVHTQVGHSKRLKPHYVYAVRLGMPKVWPPSLERYLGPYFSISGGRDGVGRGQVKKKQDSVPLGGSPNLPAGQVALRGHLNCRSIPVKATGTTPVGRVPLQLPRWRCCRESLARGLFLGKGFISNPDGAYHLEIAMPGTGGQELAWRLLVRLGLKPGRSVRRRSFIVYLKSSEQVSSFLGSIGAHTAVLQLESVRIHKEVRGSVNRVVNCETSNLNKTVDAALRQIEQIRYLCRRVGLENLSPPLREIAELRMAHPDSSLLELGQMLTPRLGKSAVNHRLRRLERFASQLRLEEA